MPTNIPSVSTFSDANLSAPYDPLRSPSKAIAFWLRRDIVRGVFAPMERLTVEPLVQFYGVGHSPVREAIILLSSSGLVIHEHLKGYRVAPVSLADYDDVLGVYQRLYKLAIGMAVERGDEAWEERVVVQLHRSTKVATALSDGDPEARERWQRAYGELHAHLLTGCGSPLMMQLFGDVGSRLERYVYLFGDLTSDKDRDLHAEHRIIVEAVLARDRERVPEIIDRYFAIGQPIRNSIITKLRAEAPGAQEGRRAPAASLARAAE